MRRKVTTISLWIYYLLLFFVICFIAYSWYMSKNTFYLLEDKISLSSNSDYQIIIFDDYGEVDIKSFEFYSSDTSVAKIDENGTVVAVGEGVSLITVKAKGTSTEAKININVKDMEIETLSFESDKYVIVIGDIAIYSPLINGNSSNKANLLWSVLDNSIASIDKNGKIIAIKTGKTIINVSNNDESIKDQANLIVVGSFEEKIDKMLEFAAADIEAEKLRLAEEARLKAEEEARKKAEEEARRKAEEEAKKPVKPTDPIVDPVEPEEPTDPVEPVVEPVDPPSTSTDKQENTNCPAIGSGCYACTILEPSSSNKRIYTLFNQLNSYRSSKNISPYVLNSNLSSEAAILLEDIMKNGFTDQDVIYYSASTSDSKIVNDVYNHIISNAFVNVSVYNKIGIALAINRKCYPYDTYYWAIIIR